MLFHFPIGDESIGEGNVGAVAISPLTQIPNLKDQLNKFLKQITDDGTLADIRGRWLLKHEMVMPDIPEAVDPKLHLTVGTTGVSEPFTCYVNGELVREYLPKRVYQQLREAMWTASSQTFTLLLKENRSWSFRIRHMS